MGICSLSKYLDGSQERLLKAAKEEEVLRKGLNKEELMGKRSQCMEKVLHGQYVRNEDIRDKTTWNRLRKGALKKETERTITAV